MPKRAVLLVNLGSPDSTAVPDVRRYLREFLGDERVLDLPAPLRRLVLEAFILPTRPKRDGPRVLEGVDAEGSPLVVTSSRVGEARSLVGAETPVFLAMRYGNPSIASVVGAIAAAGVEDILLFPQYPHYAMSSWETVVVRVTEEIASRAPAMRVTCVQPFYGDPDYIEVLRKVAAPLLSKPHDHLLISYHGIPVRHLRKADSSRCPLHPVCRLLREAAPPRMRPATARSA
jgi:ferrochelatase